jgi:SagB-type dehydrogenase family enzyme
VGSSRRSVALFRRESSLVCHWDGDRLVFENYATGVRLSASPLVCQLLHLLGRWRSFDELCAELPDYTRSSLRFAAAALERHSMLRRSDRPVDARILALDAWSSWNPSAGFFHLSTKDVPYARDLEAAERLLLRKAKHAPMPPPIKRYRNAPHIRLPQAKTDGAYPDVLLARRTWRAFSRQRLSLPDLSTLLKLTWGVQKWLDLRGLPRTPLKTSPSGGARHPIEVYVLALRVDGVPRGLYHYAADRHQLERLKSGATARQVLAYLPTQRWFTGAAALSIMTAVFPRTQWRYQFPRAYRVVLAEAGHLCQTFCLTATWLGLAPFCTMALADSRIERDLGIDGVTESVLYVAGVGARPKTPI